MTTAIAKYESDVLAPVSVDSVVDQVVAIKSLIERVMQKDHHYGVIKGCGDKPTLLKPGAEKLCLTFGLSPRYEVKEKNFDGGHREYEITCRLVSNRSSATVGEGIGTCSTMEGKYRYRNGGKVCPQCGADAILKSKQDPGWFCWAMKGGCGAKFKANDPAITEQVTGRVEFDNPADYYNTVIKMAQKRAMIAATITALGVSDLFTQDIEDMREIVKNPEPDVVDVEFHEANPEKEDGPNWFDMIGECATIDALNGVAQKMKAAGIGSMKYPKISKAWADRKYAIENGTATDILDQPSESSEPPETHDAYDPRDAALTTILKARVTMDQIRAHIKRLDVVKDATKEEWDTIIAIATDIKAGKITGADAGFPNSIYASQWVAVEHWRKDADEAEDLSDLTARYRVRYESLQSITDADLAKKAVMILQQRETELTKKEGAK